MHPAESGVFSKVRVCEATNTPVGCLSDRTVLRSKMEGPRPDKFAFAQRSGAMKAPVGLLSDRTVLRKQDGGASPRQVHVDTARFCGNLSQQLNITYRKFAFYICCIVCIRYPVVSVCKNVRSPNQPIKNRNSRDIFYSPLHNGIKYRQQILSFLC